MRVPDRTLGVGRVVASVGGEAIVEFFESPGTPPFQLRLSVSRLEGVTLAAQTRCYVRLADGSMTIGRVHRFVGGEYEVDFPDRRTGFVRPEALHVRCGRPIDDPIETLVMKGHETPYFHDRRAAFVETLMAQRAASRGMTGLLSANVDLLRHQVEIVRRVLEDPVQRYLLADEVGLGKTIEAGAIIRQFLLDDQAGRVLVLMPPALQAQWAEELEAKFHVSQFPGRVTLRTTGEIGTALASEAWDLVVIDEAHHVASWAASSHAEDVMRFEAGRRMAHGAERLLLLSATPVLHHERAFLAMLHLLDPAAYALDDLEGFRERVARRQEIGHVLLGLEEDAATFALEMFADDLRIYFPHDVRLRALLDDLVTRAQASEADPAATAEVGASVRAVRTHLAETYRLHRRLLRTRRAGVTDLALARSAEDGSLRVREEYDEDDRMVPIHELLDQWRLDAVQAAKSDEGTALAWRHVFAVLVAAAGSTPALLAACAESRRAGRLCPRVVRAFGLEAARGLQETPRFPEEADALDALLNAARREPEYGDRIDQLGQVLGQLVKQRKAMRGVKTVVFTAYAETGTAIAERLVPKFADQLATHLEDQSPAERQDALRRFLVDPGCQVLVCDLSGEEGLNLQHADWLVHFDLPWSANRLEQRIGRLDRIGRRGEVSQCVFPGPEIDDAPWDAYYALLAEGFRVFNRSIASLQYFVEAQVEVVECELFVSGATGLRTLVPEVQAGIGRQLTQIEEQNVLDEIEAHDEGSESAYEAMRALDAEPERLREGFEAYFCEALRFRRVPSGAEAGVVRYESSKQTLIPGDLLADRFEPALEVRGIFGRSRSARKAGTELLRVGQRLMDELAAFVRWDDRGQAYALWRQMPGWPADEGAEWTGFRFDFVVEADLGAAETILTAAHIGADLKALARRADAYFPPAFATLWLDAACRPVTDAALLAVLARRYDKRHEDGARDWSLAKGRLPILEAMARDGWAPACRQARSAAEEALRGQADFLATCDTRAERAARGLEKRVLQLGLRAARLAEADAPEAAAAVREHALETAMAAALVEGIRRPRTRLDAVGFFVIAGRPPGGAEDDDER